MNHNLYTFFAAVAAFIAAAAVVKSQCSIKYFLCPHFSFQIDYRIGEEESGSGRNI